ncbi:MAG: 2-amino-4-hydroxy-6-hydroxymethyldihydropteridine diphosphokinase [Luteimonas sp.]
MNDAGVASERVIAYVGLGANLGEASRTVREAMEALDAIPNSRRMRASRLYRTAAWGREDQPDFVNAVAQLETALAPRALLTALLEIERAFGRDRAGEQERWGPRTLDLDLLLYGAQTVDEPGLRVPHPHLHERAFVLVPLDEIAPELAIPKRGSVADALAAMATDGVQAIG